MVEPPRRRTAQDEKRLVLRHAGRMTEKAQSAEQARNDAIRFASEVGASLREIETATGVPFATVRRIIERTPPTGIAVL